jgi:hypothetical protein
MFFGAAQLVILDILEGSVATPSPNRTCQKYSTMEVAKMHLESFAFN